MTQQSFLSGAARVARRWAAAGAVGYVFVFYSEMVFWARLKTEEHLAEYPATWLVYSLAAFATLAVAERFRARGWHAFFLCGAVFGWLIEGIVVQTTYEDLPLSISFTGLGWHAPITLGLGWWLMSRYLAEQSWRRTAALSLGLGLFFGLWAVCWWFEEDDVRTPAEFCRYVFGCSLPLIAAHAIWHRRWWTRPSRVEEGLLAGFIAVVFCLGTVPAAPMAAILAPLLFGSALWALHRLGAAQTESGLAALAGPARPEQLFLTLLIPATAVTVYTGIHATGLRPPTHWVVYIVTTPLGFLLYGWAFWRALRVRRRVLL